MLLAAACMVQEQSKLPPPGTICWGLLHPRELLLLGVAALSLCSLVLLGLGILQNPEESMVQWAERDWRKTRCKVSQVGIAYTGDCHDSHLERRTFKDPPVYNYSTCPHQAPEEFPCDAVAANFQERRLASDTGGAQGPRRLPVKHLHEQLVCKDQFLAWAAVELMEQSHWHQLPQ